jgi:flagellar biosynthesis protein FlhA
MLNELNRSIIDVLNSFREMGFLPIVITSATIRPYFYRLINSTFSDIIVLSYTELPPNVEIEFIGKIEV